MSIPASSTRAQWTRITAILERVERGGWRMVTMFRLVPVIPHSLSNYALGLTRLRLGDYALGSLLGQLPLTIAAVDLGAAGERAMRGAADWLLPTLIGLAALAMTADHSGDRPPPASARGLGPPVAQSSSSTVCTTGTGPGGSVCRRAG